MSAEYAVLPESNESENQGGVVIAEGPKGIAPGIAVRVGGVAGVATSFPEDGKVIVEREDGKVLPYDEREVEIVDSSQLDGDNSQSTPQNDSGEPEPVGVGKFGEIYDQFKGKVKEAVAFLLRRKNGEAVGALHHGEVGDISVVYGNDGYGLAHIAKKHPEVLSDLQGTIDGMVVTSQSDNRIVLESSTHRAVISKMLGNEPTSNWLLTAYEKKNPASASSSDIETEPEGKQNGTATLQNEISQGEDSENKSDMQEGGVNTPAIPVDAKGKKLYEQAPIESTINAIYNNPELDEMEADALVAAKIAGATKRIAQLEKKKPKMGEDEDAYIAERAKWREQLESEQASLAYWQGVQEAVPEMRRKERAKRQMEADIAQREREQQERAEQSRRAEERGRNRGDYRKAIAGWEDTPSSFHEYVAQALLVGNHKMRWNDNGSTRGLGSHTTGRRGVNRRGEVVTARNDESRAMGWLIDDRGGLSPEALADKLWNEYTGSYGEDMSEGSPLDVLLDVVTSMPTPQMMWDYVKGEHDARMEAEQGGYEEQYSAEEIEAFERDAMYREKYGVSEEEYWANEAQWDEFIESREMSAEELDNYDNFVAEERIKEEHERRNKENAEDEQRSDNSESEGGVEVLSGTQPDITRGNEDVAGESEGVDGNGVESNDVAQEEATELSEEDRQAIDNMPIPMLKRQIKDTATTLFNVSQNSDQWQAENKDKIERAKLLLAYAKQELARKERLKKSNKWGVKVGNTATPFDVVRKMFEEFNSNEDLAQLFEKVAKVFETLPIKVVFSDTIGAKSTQGWFSPTTGTLKLPGYFVYGGGISEQNKAETILHEMIHAVTTYALYINEKPYLQTELGFRLSDDMHAAIRQLKRIYASIANDKDFKGEYGAVSVHEMIAELSNVQFREKLKKKGLWETIVDAIKQLFGITPSNALEGAEAALEYMLNNFDRSQWEKMAGMGEKRGKQMRIGRKENRSDVNRQDLTTSSSSQVNDRTKIKINPDTAKESLKKLAEKYQGETSTRGFLTDLNIALGLTEIDAPSNYYSLELPNGNEVTIRISNHNADAENADIGEKEVSIVVKSRRSRNTFKSKDGVDLTEYVYFKEAIKSSKGNVLSQIAESLSEMMDTGEYQDKSGIAKINLNQEERAKEDSEEGLLFRDGDVFYSNAEEAVRNIKQEKATPEQWLAMIQKNGGLKAGEDKWLGLSEWLKSQMPNKQSTPSPLRGTPPKQGSRGELTTASKTGERYTLTKQEVLEFIAQNKIKIEEVGYGGDSIASAQSEFDELTEELGGYDEAFEEMVNRYGDDFREAVWYDEVGQLHLEDGYEDYGEILGIERGINRTRLDYTTEGLENKKEIALVVPSVDPYNTHDEIHFGEAGGGRAVAWVRFGETRVPRQEEVKRSADELEAPYKNANGRDVWRVKGRKNDYIAHSKLKNGMERYLIYVNDKLIGTTLEDTFDTLEEAQTAMNRYYAEHPVYKTVYDNVLVIDEIQSKRHQDGREKGYRGKDVAQREARIAEIRGRLRDVVARKKEIEDKIPEDIKGILNRAKYRRALPEGAEYERLRDEEIALRGELDEITLSMSERNAVPDAPFEKNWHELAMKRMLRYAAENGFDKVAWTTGVQQAERYDIGNMVSGIEVRRNNAEGEYNVMTYDASGNLIPAGSGTMTPQQITETFGKELGQKMLAVEAGEKSTFDGGDLRLGGEGMKGFYDKMLPSFMNKYGKKWGVKVGEVTMPNIGDSGLTMHSIDVTDAMRESVMEGQPLFRDGERIEDVNERFNAELEAFDNGTHEGELHLGQPGAILQASGLNATEMYIAPRTLKRHLAKHGLMTTDIQNLPKALQTPLMVYEWGTKAKSLVVITQIPRGEQRITIAVKLERGGSRLEVNEIASVHGKDIERVLSEINTTKTDFGKENLKYVDKEIAKQWLGLVPPKGTASLTKAQQRATNIVENFENPTIGDEISAREGDGAYTDAEVSMANDPIAKVMGRSQRSGKQQAKFAERERKAMRNRVAELAEKMHLDNVEVVDNSQLTTSPLSTPQSQATAPLKQGSTAGAISSRKARAKGWFDTRTGKIVINISNHLSVADVERTLLHEAVAHYGLRQLFGKQFDTFLDNVYLHADAEVRAQIVELAKRRGWDFRTATEEYLAGLAEDTNFEALEHNWSWWQKIKQLFMDMLESIGWDYKGPELSDNELRYLLWRSYENMVNPGRHRSILGMAEDVAKQYALGVGNYSADAETMSHVAESEEVYSEAELREMQQEESSRQFAKVKELHTALKEAGHNGFHISRSVTDWGVSTYLQGNVGTIYAGIKYRISDHGVTSTRRVLEERMIDYTTSANDIVAEVTKIKELREQADAIIAQKERAKKEKRKLLDVKWERIKHFFDGLRFHRMERTYQNFEKIASDVSRGNILQKELGNGAFSYEYTTEPNGYGSKKPSYDYIEAFDEENAEIVTTRFRDDETIGEKRVKNVVVDMDTAPKSRKEAIGLLSTMQQPFHNADQDADIYVSNRDARHSMQFRNDAQIHVFGALPKIIESAVKIGDVEVAEDEKNTTKSVSIYYCPINVDGVQYSGRMVVKEYYNGTHVLDELHLYNILLKEATPDAQNASSQGIPVHPSSVDEYKVKDLIHNSQEQDKELLGINETTLFRDGDGVPTAEESVAAYIEQFNNVGEIELIDSRESLGNYFRKEHGLNEEEIKEVLESLEDSPAAYDKIKDKILIFAWKNQNIYFNLIHEHCHKAIDNLGGIGKFNELIEDFKAIDPKLWNSINKCYDEDVEDEVLAYMVQYIVSSDLIEETKGLLSTEAQIQLNKIINYLGYGNVNKINQQVKRFNTRYTEPDVTFYQNRIRNVIRRRNEQAGRIYEEKGEVGKGNEKANDIIESEEVGDEGILFRDGESDGTREEYNRKVRRPNRSGSVGKWDNLGWRMKEAYQDSMLSLKELQEVIAKKYGLKEIPSWMNAYLQENLMSSRNKAASDVYMRDFYNPMMKEVQALIKEGVKYEDLVNYMIAKHGLERNVVMAERDAKRAADEAVKEIQNSLDKELNKYKKANELFNQQLQDFESNSHEGNLVLGEPSPILEACGIDVSSVFITPKTLKAHLDKHGLTINDIKDLPKALLSPLMVYEWGTTAKSMIVITHIPRGEQRITIAIKLERGGKRVEVNEIASIHGKDSARFIDEMIKSRRGGLSSGLKYVDKENALNWLGIVPPKGTAPRTQQERIANIIEKFENPTTKIQKIQDAIRLEKAKFDGVLKNLPLSEANKWYDTRKKTLDTLLQNNKISLIEYGERVQKLNTLFNGGYVAENRKRDYSGLTALTGEESVVTAEEVAEKMVEEFEGAHETDALWEKVNAATKETLRKSYEGGLMSKETYESTDAMYEHYIPLRGWDSDIASDMYEYLMSDRPLLSPALKTAKGRTSLADDPIATIGMMADSTIAQANRNKMKQAFLNFYILYNLFKFNTYFCTNK